MCVRLPKLLEIYQDWACEEGASLPFAAVRVASCYSIATLVRMLAASDTSIRLASAWGLGLIGGESQIVVLGGLLRDERRGVRTVADEARRCILSRTQSPWHRHCEQQIEELLASSEMVRACELATHLVEETECRSDAYLMRAWVRFCNQHLEGASEDCKKTLSLDPYCYRACVALGQCFWHQNRDAAARECFYESIRIYPDWEPGYSALRMMQGSRSAA